MRITTHAIIVHDFVASLALFDLERTPLVETMIVRDIGTSGVVVVEGLAFVTTRICGAAAEMGILVGIDNESSTGRRLSFIKFLEESLDIFGRILAVITLVVTHFVALVTRVDTKRRASRFVNIAFQVVVLDRGVVHSLPPTVAVGLCRPE